MLKEMEDLARICYQEIYGSENEGRIAELHARQEEFRKNFQNLLRGSAPVPAILPVGAACAKFALLADLGTIAVPADYVHGTRLAEFRKKRGYSNDITDQNFPNPSRILKPGDKLHVRAWKQVVPLGTTSEERMAFLKTQNVVFTGAQGASLVFEQKRDQLPKGYWYASFDEKDRLWEGACGYRRVPCVLAYSDGDFYFDLGYFEYPWYGNDAFLSFSDLP